jgi:putative acetyltransferase
VDEDLGFPPAHELSRVGTYPAEAKAGGGYVWDAVLEYRVWCRTEQCSGEQTGDDYYRAFGTYAEALAFSDAAPEAEEPLALVLQEEYIDEPTPGDYLHVVERRFTEWPVSFLRRPRRSPRTIPDFLAPDAPANRLDIIRGLAE